METRANYVLIGAFTLAVIAAAFGFVLWFQSLHTTKQRSPLRVIFEGGRVFPEPGEEQAWLGTTPARQGAGRGDHEHAAGPHRREH